MPGGSSVPLAKTTSMSGQSAADAVGTTGEAIVAATTKSIATVAITMRAPRRTRVAGHLISAALKDKAPPLTAVGAWKQLPQLSQPSLRYHKTLPRRCGVESRLGDSRRE